MSEAYIYAPETIIKAYSLGVFPMAESRDDGALHFYEPQQRGILPINPPHIPRRLLRLVRQTRWQVSINTDFRAVIEGCAEQTESREDSWINAEIIRLYLALHKMGFAHSFEVWEDKALIGGLYGINGRCLFWRIHVLASQQCLKIALAHLMARLYYGNFTLLDAQFTNDHLLQFGLIEVPKQEFQKQLQTALAHPAELPMDSDPEIIFAHLAQAKTVTS